MTSKKTTKRALFSSVVALLLCFAMLMGTTMAWFTDSVSNGINKIQSGNLNVVLEHKYFDEADYQSMTDYAPVEADTALFLNIDGQPILWEPGACADEYFKVTNNGSLALKYRFKVAFANATATPEGKTLADVLSIYAVYRDYPNMNDSPVEGYDQVALKDFVFESHLLPGESHEFQIGVEWKSSDVDNEYNVEDGLSIDLGVSLVATQYAYEKDAAGDQYDANAEYPEVVIPWTGTADTTWYDPAATTFSLNTAEQFAGLAELVDEGNTFEGKTINLESDVDLNNIVFEPIGSYRDDTPFKGTFDGQGHTIMNLSQNTWALDNGYYYGDLGLGLFGLVEDAEIKNLNMDNADLSGESAIVGIVAATAYGDCTFENINVTNSRGADYQYYAGGIVGWASGNHQYINCDVDASTTIAAQWGDFDNSTGGIIGGAGGSATIYLKDCDVACRIDAYNDVTSSYQWYAYRRCGMLIGNTGKEKVVDGTTYADAPQLTCENVTVTYGEWANYTYCEFAGTSWPYVRVQAGISNSAYSNPRYGHPVDANGNEVVDDNHVHNDGEDHFILCEFDQLYGGGQGVYGTATHDGVTVVYNNH